MISTRLFDTMHRVCLPILLFGLGVGLVLFTGRLSAQVDDVSESVFVHSNGYHSALVVPALGNNLTNLDLEPEDLWIEYSWGDSGFFTAEGYPIALILKAMFTHTSTVMHVKPVNNRQLAHLKRNYSFAEIKLNPSQTEKLRLFISKSFVRDPEQKFAYLHPGWGRKSRFYRAKGSYMWYYTCNSWTADALRQTGIRMPLWDLTPKPILAAVSRNG